MNRNLISQVEVTTSSSLAMIRTTDYDAVFSSDLKSNVQNCNIFDKAKDSTLTSIFHVPMVPTRNFNCVSNTDSVFKIPDISVQSAMSNYGEQYLKLLSRKRTFNKKVGYFTYAQKN